MNNTTDEIAFILTGITPGELLNGVKMNNDKITVESICIYRDIFGNIVHKKILNESQKKYFSL